MDIGAYLERLGLEATPDPTLASLDRLHRAHLRRVPFENLDIHRRVPLSLEPAALFDKIVARRRGGLCYELNGLFALLLEGLGFAVARLSVRVHGAGGLGPPFEHLALKVDIDGNAYLADVGFGASFERPLPLRHGAEQRLGNTRYRLARAEGTWTLEQERPPDGGAGGSETKSLYCFTLQPYPLLDFGPMCLFHQTDPASHFNRQRLCTRALPRGRDTLSGMRFIETRDGEKTERPVESQAEYRQILLGAFGIEY